MPSSRREASEAAGETRELARDECLRLLAEHSFGRLAVSAGDGAPVIRPVNYSFDDASKSVVFRTSAGSKFHALVRAAHAAFEIDGVDEGAGTGWSVIISGVAEEVTQGSEIRRLDALRLQSWAPGEKPRWLRIRAWTVSGRRVVLPERAPRGADPTRGDPPQPAGR
ncbi:MAG: pyridoxamine 5'-phosphate oxidase family protein [Solirubrobacterales bacterium]|nr:pyridoxamine 5'-phosphate oxidase family protein [Solirubrobacterales bacterium]MBV9717066.1 pyridoxamine 5'-phosphate oxidase family protein [Solirubrobacterales bacterium]